MMGHDIVLKSHEKCFMLVAKFMPLRSPYKDSWLMAAQVLCILAFLFSWIFWGAFAFGCISTLMQLLLWCCRQSQGGLVVSAVSAGMASALAFYAGYFMLTNWSDSSYCLPFVLSDLTADDDQVVDEQFCPEKILAAVAFADGAIWLLSACCMMVFVCSGEHKNWEIYHRSSECGKDEIFATDLEHGRSSAFSNRSYRSSWTEQKSEREIIMELEKIRETASRITGASVAWDGSVTEHTQHTHTNSEEPPTMSKKRPSVRSTGTTPRRPSVISQANSTRSQRSRPSIISKSDQFVPHADAYDFPL